MEMFELRYFIGVARHENIHRASETLNVSPAALSKAISRLEDELSVTLFSREGRNIRLTSQGRLLQQKASEIIQLEESTRLALAGHEGSIKIVLSGPEVLLSEMGISILCELQEQYPKSVFEFHTVDDEEAIQEVFRGEAHLAISTIEPPNHLGLSSVIISEASFQTVVGEGHSLYEIAKARKSISVAEVLKFPFVCPNNLILGKVGAKQSFDGWRDDQFPRRMAYLTSSIKLIEKLVVNGRALACLPDYYVSRIGAHSLKIVGCPFSCSQKIRLIAKNPKDRSWMHQWF